MYGDEAAIEEVLSDVRTRAGVAVPPTQARLRSRDPAAPPAVGVEVVNEPGKVVIGANDRAIFDDALAQLRAAGFAVGTFAVEASAPFAASQLLWAALVAFVASYAYLFLLTDAGDRFLAEHAFLRDWCVVDGGTYAQPAPGANGTLAWICARDGRRWVQGGRAGVRRAGAAVVRLVRDARGRPAQARLLPVDAEQGGGGGTTLTAKGRKMYRCTLHRTMYNSNTATSYSLLVVRLVLRRVLLHGVAVLVEFCEHGAHRVQVLLGRRAGLEELEPLLDLALERLAKQGRGRLCSGQATRHRAPATLSLSLCRVCPPEGQRRPAPL